MAHTRWCYAPALQDDSATPDATRDPLSTPFPSPFRTEHDCFSIERQPRSLVELAMGRLSAAIRSKADWRSKRHDVHIVEKWRTEALALSPLLSPAAIQYVLDELGWYDGLLEAETGCSMSVVDGVWQSETLLGSELTGSMQRAVAQCWGELTDEQRDWHPGSERVVWDMVHPSLYPLVAGRTRVVAEDVPLASCIARMGSGRVLSVTEYGRQMTKRAAAMRVQGNRVGNHYAYMESRRADSDNESLQQSRAVDRQFDRAEKQQVASASAAWEAGKILLRVCHSCRTCTVYVRPNDKLEDVRRELALRLPTCWGPWTLKRVGQPLTPEDETRPLYTIGIHSTGEANTDELRAEQDEAAKLAAEQAERSNVVRQYVRIQVETVQWVPISAHRLEQSTTVHTLLQQLCDGAGVVKRDFYPDFARGVPPSQQRLYRITYDNTGETSEVHRKRLLPHRTLAHYQLYNGGRVELVWHRATLTELVAETNTIELRVQPLSNAQAPAHWIDADLHATVGWLRELMAALLSTHRWRDNKLPAEHCRLFLPAVSPDELSDDDLPLSALGSASESGEAVLGMRLAECEAEEILAHVAEEQAKRQAETNQAKSEEENTAAAILIEGAPSSSALEVEDDETKHPDDQHSDARWQQPTRSSDDNSVTQPAADAEAKQDAATVRLIVGTTDAARPCLSIDAQLTVTVREIKQRIENGQVDDNRSDDAARQRAVGVPVAEQQLRFIHKVMNDARTLAFYGLTSASHGQYLSWSRLDPSTRRCDETGLDCTEAKRRRLNGTAGYSSGGPLALELSVVRLYGGKPDAKEGEQREAADFPSDLTVGGLRQGILAMMDRSTEIKRVRVKRVEGAYIESDQLTLTEAGITDGDTVVADIASVTVDVTLVLLSGGLSTFTLLADPHDTVRELKQRIAVRPDGYPVEWQWVDLTVRTHIRNSCGDQVSTWPATCVDDDQPLSQYGVSTDNVYNEADMLVCRRPLPRAAQQNEQELPQQLLHLPVCVTATNDIHVVQVMAWQPLAAVKWHLARMQLEDFDSQRLSLCPPAPAISTVLWRTPGNSFDLLKDDTASLPSLGVIDGRMLQLDRSEVVLPVRLPQGVQQYHRPMQATSSHTVCVLHAQLDDTVAELKVRLQSLVNMPADRMLLRFHRLPPVQIDDSLTLEDMDFDSREAREQVKPRWWLRSYVRENELTVRLLPHPATQPPSVEQQHANGLVHVGVRLLAHSGRVHRMWLLLGEKVSDARVPIVHMLTTTLERVDYKRRWKSSSVTLTVGGLSVDDDSAVSALLVDEWRQLPIIDVLIRPRDDEQERQLTTQYTATFDALPAGGSRFCLHPQHPLRLVKPYVTGADAETTWCCVVCAREQDLTPDRRCWHCAICKFDVCQRCFNSASSAEPQGIAAELGVDGGTLTFEPTSEQQSASESDQEDEYATSGDYHTSARYAWLPADFHIGHDGTARCLSYINSLHPVQHAVMYDRLERVVACFVPLFERVLTSLRHPRPPKVPVGSWYDPTDAARFYEDSMAARLAQSDESSDASDEEDEVLLVGDQAHSSATRPTFPSTCPAAFHCVPARPPPADHRQARQHHAHARQAALCRRRVARGRHAQRVHRGVRHRVLRAGEHRAIVARLPLCRRLSPSYRAERQPRSWRRMYGMRRRCRNAGAAAGRRRHVCRPLSRLPQPLPAPRGAVQPARPRPARPPLHLCAVPRRPCRPRPQQQPRAAPAGRVGGGVGVC